MKIYLLLYCYEPVLARKCGFTLSYVHTTAVRLVCSKRPKLFETQLKELARMYLQTPLRLPEIFPIGQWTEIKLTEVRHLTDSLALKLVRNGTKVSLMGSLMDNVLRSCTLSSAAR